jgi:acyl-CoA synthetase (AMP-forming)/AMP-acid ligase II
MPVVLPLFHVTGLDALVLPVLATGGTVLLYQGFDAAVIAGAIEQYQATHLVFIPTMWEAMLTQLEREPVDTRSVEIGLYAMSPMSLERLDAMRAAFPNADILLASGMTETTPASEVQWPAHQRAKHGSWGSPSITTDVRIMDSDGTLLGPGEEGEIVYRTPQLMSQYWQNPAANREAFAHGWFHSGDIGYVDEDGVVWFTDRLKDIVKTGGENVSSLEVEQVILQHPGVLECAVVGRPHERWGEAVIACVVPVDGVVLAEAEVIAHCKQRLAGYKVPKRVDFHNSLPHTATGKVEKHKLRSV